MPPLGKLPTVHVPEPPDDPELPELPDEPELEDEDTELEPDDPELELLPELELEPELAPEAIPELEPLDPDVEPDEPWPELEPALPSGPVRVLLSLEDEHDASRAIAAGRTRSKGALMANLPVGRSGGSLLSNARIFEPQKHADTHSVRAMPRGQGRRSSSEAREPKAPDKERISSPRLGQGADAQERVSGQ